MNKPTYMLSPCGTSLLTNIARSIKNKEINYANLARTYANTKNKKNIPKNDRNNLEHLISEAKSKLLVAGVEEAKKQSAELNGILSYYKDSKPKNNDYFELLSTDTWLGEQTALIVKAWLETNFQNCTVIIYKANGLQTKSFEDFHQAVAEILKKIHEEDRKSYNNVVFNLTGGFKSVIGFLQSIANIYANEIIYVFEGSGLLRIPSIPVKLMTESIVNENKDAFRMLSLNLSPRKHTISDIFLLKIDTSETLNVWGELVWENQKPNIYKKELLNSPHPNIKYTPTFEKSVEQFINQADRISDINNRIDDFTRYLVSKQNLARLDFKQLKNIKHGNSTHEIDAWSDKDAKRIFLHKEGNNWVLDELAKAIH